MTRGQPVIANVKVVGVVFAVLSNATFFHQLITSDSSSVECSVVSCSALLLMY